MSDSINLLKNKKEKSDYKNITLKIRILRYVSLIILFLVSVSSMTLFFIIAFSPLPALQKDEARQLSLIAQYHPQIAKLFMIRDRLENSKEFLNSRKEYDVFITSLQSQLPQNVSIGDISFNEEKGTIEFSSSSLEFFDQLSNLLSEKAKKKEFISSVTLQGISSDETTKRYTIDYKVDIL